MKTSQTRATAAVPPQDAAPLQHPVLNSKVTSSGFGPTKNGVRPLNVDGRSPTHTWRLEVAAGSTPVLFLVPTTSADGRRLTFESPETERRAVRPEDVRVLRDVLNRTTAQMTRERSPYAGEPVHRPVARLAFQAATDLLETIGTPYARDLASELGTAHRSFGGGPPGMVETDIQKALLALEG